MSLLFIYLLCCGLTLPVDGEFILVQGPVLEHRVPICTNRNSILFRIVFILFL